MRWELTQTGGLTDIAFMVVDIVQRESLALIFFVECGPVLQVYTSPWGSYQHVLVTLIMENALKSRAANVGMALTAGAAWAINCKAKPVGS